ncbi:MAG TPA: MOSC domain-containing protein [Methylomirabilota bacterium]|nr:MOSC domain-containing protein [Methylomirabilota bacterium]
MAQAIRPMPEEIPVELWRGFKAPRGWQGSVAAIFIAPEPSGAMIPVPQARAFADRGLEGDRFFRDSWNAVKRPDKAVSLIEEEVLKLAEAELGVGPIADKTRRNIVTRGVPLVELLRREFTLGGVRMRGIRLFEPCGHLVAISKMPGIFQVLHHRSGLKAAILSDGVIRVGDPIALDAVAAAASG